MSENTWRYRLGDVEHGPMSGQDLCGLFSAGTLALTTIVWCPLVDQWVAASTIPAFRSAAAAAPNARRDGNFYRTAARFAWLSPAIAFGLHMLMTGAAQTADPHLTSPKQKVIESLLGGLLILGGFLAGAIALLFAPSTVRRRILFPAIGGLALNGVAILSGIFAFATPGAEAMASSPAQIARDGMTSVLDYPGWVGSAKLPGGGVIVLDSLDDTSPTAKRILTPLQTHCSVIAIAVRGTGKPTQFQFYDPASVVLQLSDGKVAALPLTRVLASAPPTATRWIRQIGGLQVVPADTNVHEAVCFIPPDIDLPRLTAISINIDGHRLTVPGRVISVEEKHRNYQAAADAGQVPKLP